MGGFEGWPRSCTGGPQKAVQPPIANRENVGSNPAWAIPSNDSYDSALSRVNPQFSLGCASWVRTFWAVRLRRSSEAPRQTPPRFHRIPTPAPFRGTVRSAAFRQGGGVCGLASTNNNAGNPRKGSAEGYWSADPPAPRSRTRFSDAKRLSMSWIRERAMSARFLPYSFDGSKSIMVSITSSGSVIVNDVCPGVLGIAFALSRHCKRNVVDRSGKSESDSLLPKRKRATRKPRAGSV